MFDRLARQKITVNFECKKPLCVEQKGGAAYKSDAVITASPFLNTGIPVFYFYEKTKKPLLAEWLFSIGALD